MYRHFFKRLFDILLSLILCILLAPVLLIAAIAVKVDSKGPVIFKQERLGVGGKVFRIYKFRSMCVNAEHTGSGVYSGKNDARVTRVGKLLRASSIDELPQLLNILKGDMSIVGPRPERREIADRYRRELPEFDYRLKVPGGLTGYAQIYGKYNTTPADKLRLDLIYIENYSLLLDIRLMLLTLRILFTKESTQGVAKCS